MTIDGSLHTAPVDVHLLLTPGSDPVRGRLEVDDGGVDFEGYVELIAALQRVLTGDPPADPDRRKTGPDT